MAKLIDILGLAEFKTKLLALIGANNGIAGLDSSGKVPTAQLPSYVDDVVEYASSNNFPATGESGKIYVATDTNTTYRWSGSTYIAIGSGSGDLSSKADKADTVLDTTLSRGRAANSTVGTGSIAFGNNTTAEGNYSYSFGEDIKNVSPYSFVVGKNNSLNCGIYPDYSTSAIADIGSRRVYNGVGYVCKTKAEAAGEFNRDLWDALSSPYAFIFEVGAGLNNTRRSVFGITPDGACQVGFLNNSYPLGLNAFACNSSYAKGEKGFAANNGVSSGVKASAFGQSSATGDYSFSEGNYETKAIGSYSHAEGYASIADGISSHAEGHSNASGQQSHAEGAGSAMEINSHAEGCGTAEAKYSHAEGFYTVAHGYYSHAEGNDESKNMSVTLSTEGYEVTFSPSAYGIAAHKEGYKTCAYGNYSHSEGEQTYAYGTDSHAEGSRTQARGSSSHAEGTISVAAGSYSHAEGSTTIASGNNSHAEGDTTTASALSAHAEGSSTVASGGGSHAEGGNTKATAAYAHAEGNYTEANASYSHAQGDHTIANGYYQHVFGKYNVADTTSVEIVGYGNDNNNRKNIRVLDNKGNETLAGGLTIGQGTAGGSLTIGSTTLTEANLQSLLALLS